MLEKQFEYVSVINVPILASSSLDPLMYIRSLIPQIIALPARQRRLAMHFLTIFQQDVRDFYILQGEYYLMRIHRLTSIRCSTLRARQVR